jgi:hypothetical protein
LLTDEELLDVLLPTDDFTELATLELATLLDATEQLRTKSHADVQALPEPGA